MTDLAALTARAETWCRDWEGGLSSDDDAGMSGLSLIRDLLTYATTVTRENTALRKPMQKHCPSCVDAQCWGVRVAAEQERDAAIASAKAAAAQLVQTLDP